MRKAHRVRILGTALVVTLLFTACGGDESGDESKKGTATGGNDAEAVEQLVRKSIEAENAQDSKTFAALWTDKGLEAYDVGRREELEAGPPEGFGAEKLTVLEFAEVEAEGGKGSATVDVLSGEHTVAEPVFRARLDAIESDGKWLLDGFEFLGSPPPAQGAPVVNVDAREYAFMLDKTEASGNLAFKFVNNGKEHHEIALFKGPAGTDVATAKTALENVDGRELSNLPAGYQADHIAFGEPGMTLDVTFAEPLAAGDYFLVCYIPQGGFTAEGETDPDQLGEPLLPANPTAPGHVKLGMISKLTVT